MLKQKELMIIASLRKNSRQSLTEISRTTQIPISTIFDKLREHEKTLIKKYTLILDFSQIGYNTKAAIAIRVRDDQREEIRSFLNSHLNVNSIYKTNNDFDFLFFTFFTNNQELERFMDTLRSMFAIQDKKVYYLVEDIKREGFLSDPSILTAEH